MRARIRGLLDGNAKVRATASEQSDKGDLWFRAGTKGETDLQHELRRLHDAINDNLS